MTTACTPRVSIRTTRADPKEVHEECMHAQEEIQREIEEEDRIRHEQNAKQDVHNKHYSPNEHHTHNVTNDNDAYIISSEPHIELNNNATCMELKNGVIESLKCDHNALRLAEGDWAAE